MFNWEGEEKRGIGTGKQKTRGSHKKPWTQSTRVYSGVWKIGKAYQKGCVRVCLDTQNVWERGEERRVGERREERQRM